MRSIKSNMIKKILIFLLLMGSIQLFAEQNHSETKWYKQCDSEKMKKSYLSAFKTMAKNNFGNKLKFQYLNINSKPVEISRKPDLICKVNLSYKVILGMDYSYGTADIIQDIKGYNSKTKKVEFTIQVINEKIKNGNIIQDAVNRY